MSRSNRKRGMERYADGRITREAREDERNHDADQLGKWRRANLIVNYLIKDPRLATPLGQMLLLGHPRSISEELFEASIRAAEVYQRYDNVFLGMSRSTAPLSLDGHAGRSTADDLPEELVKRVKDDFIRVEAILGQCPVPGVRDAVKDLLRGIEPARSQIDLCIVGLKALAIRDRLDRIPQSAISARAKRYRFIGEDNLETALKVSV